ncbi:ferredoxin domain protein [alpha proteobacterium BAL199]|jgi:nitrite reductase/ring-hydroxylating ferredoxin subunit|nr:ferredoxin domain protein [alpha proteobacterium BAL199]
MSVAITEAPSQDQLDRLRDQGDRPEWVGALPLAELEAKGRAVVKRAGKQVALFVTRAGVRAIANRCPHEGYPLSEGTLAEPSGAGTGDACTLTCNWHNWKFDLETGSVVGGGDAVRVFPVEIRDGMIRIDVADPPPHERIARALAALREGFQRPERDRMARDLARIEAAGGDLKVAVAAAVEWTSEHLEYGTSHAYAAMPDWLALADGTTDPVDRLACVVETVGHINDDTLRQPAWPYPPGTRAWDEDGFVAAVEAEDEHAAVQLVRGGLRRGGFATVGRGLCRAALMHYQDFGHSAIYVEKTREAVERLGEHAPVEALVLALVRSLVTARREDLIPEFKAYRPARDAWTGRGAAKTKPADFCRASVAKCLERAVAASGSIDRLYDALLEAASWQLVRADPLYATRARQTISQNVGRLDFSHAITFANAGRRMAGRYGELWPDVLLQLACFLGRNGGFVDPGYDGQQWRVDDVDGFLVDAAANVMDHGQAEYIVTAHFAKMVCAVREEVAAAPNAAWVPALVAALNRFLNEPFRRILTRRIAHQARETIKGE